MANSSSRMLREIHKRHGLDRPSVASLLSHIFSHVFRGAMISLLIFGSAVIAYLHYYGIPSGNCFALLISTITVLSFFHGCKAWQEDLNNYQKALANARHTHDAR